MIRQHSTHIWWKINLGRLWGIRLRPRGQRRSCRDKEWVGVDWGVCLGLWWIICDEIQYIEGLKIWCYVIVYFVFNTFFKFWYEFDSINSQIKQKNSWQLEKSFVPLFPWPLSNQSLLLNNLQKPFTKILKFLHQPIILIPQYLQFPFLGPLSKVRAIHKQRTHSRVVYLCNSITDL